MGAINFSTDNEYYTPKEIVDMFGRFDYDPATTPEKAEEFGIESFDTIETDGLSSDWSKFDKIWVNPPFTAKDKFLKKAQEYYDKTGGGCIYADSYPVFNDKEISRDCQRSKNIPTEWTNKIRERTWKASKISCVWLCGYKASRKVGDRKD